MQALSRFLVPLEQIYGNDSAPGILTRLESLLGSHATRLPHRSRRGLTERDAIVIAYPDQVADRGKSGLASLEEFAGRYLQGLVSGMHLLPFYPSSSDDGFSVTDYKSVDPAFGDWTDIGRLGRRFDLMSDAVLNHASVQGDWFKAYLQGEDPYKDFFISVSGNPDLSAVVRPRTLPLLTSFPTRGGDQRAVWTTFSADQADLDYHNPAVLLEIIDVLLFYVQQGVSYLRLDAIAHLWKEIGTDCIHRPQVHWIVCLIRAILEEVAPHVMLLTETNVSQDENLSYLGDGKNEAHMVYNFALPALVLHAFHSGHSTRLSDWAANLALPSAQSTFFNVLATHDGIGLNGARGWLSDGEINEIVHRIRECGGRISDRSNSDGTVSPYEINVNYFDALMHLDADGHAELAVPRFLTAHAIMLAFQGMPGIYFHSMFGSRGWQQGVLHTGRARSVNREKLQRKEVEAELAVPSTLRAMIYDGMKRMLTARRGSRAFAPNAEQRILRAGAGILALTRRTALDGERILCLHNVTARIQRFPWAVWRAGEPVDPRAVDLITGRRIEGSSSGTIGLEPYQSMWLRMRQ